MKKAIKIFCSLILINFFLISCTDSTIIGGLNFINKYFPDNKIKFRDIMNKLDKVNSLYDSENTNIEVESLYIEGVHFTKFTNNKKKNNSVIYFVHGGSFDADLGYMYHQFVDELMTYNINFDFLLVDYSVKGENPYPKGHNDVMKGYNYLFDNYKNIYTLGDSAGGNMLMSSLLRLRDEGRLNNIKGVVLYSPILDLTFSMPSRLNNVKKDIVIGNIYTDYRIPDLLEYNPYFYTVDNKFDPKVSPIFDKYTDFPPTYIVVDIDEVLYDDSLYLHKKIPNSILRVYEGYFHDFPTIISLDMANVELRNTMDFFENLDKEWRKNE